MKVFATGKSGTIGSRLPTTVKSITCDLKDIAHCEQNSEFTGSAIIHLAGIVGTEKVKEDRQKSELVNVKYSMDLAEVARENEAGKFIFVSSGHVYGVTELEAVESQPTNPLTLYAEQKCRVEEKLTSFFKESSTTLIILRVFSVIDLQNEKPSVSLGSQIQKIISGDKRIWINNGDDVRDFLEVNKVGQILSTVADSLGEAGIYNVCSGIPMSVRDITESILAKNGIHNFSQIKAGVSSMKSNFGSRDKLSRALQNEQLFV